MFFVRVRFFFLNAINKIQFQTYHFKVKGNSGFKIFLFCPFFEQIFFPQIWDQNKKKNFGKTP